MSKSWEKVVEALEQLRISSTLLFVDSTVHEVSGSFFGKIHAVSSDPPLIGVERFESRAAMSGSKWVIDATAAQLFVDEGGRFSWFVLVLLGRERISFTKIREE